MQASNPSQLPDSTEHLSPVAAKMPMTITIAAIYEQGSLKLLQPLPLAEGTHVEITVVPVDAQPANKTPGTILAEIAALPLEGSRDAFSGRDHDQILYPSQDEA